MCLSFHLDGSIYHNWYCPGNTPSITNLAATVTFTDDTAVGTVLFTVAVADADTLDTLTTTMTTTTSLFSFDTTSCEYMIWRL